MIKARMRVGASWNDVCILNMSARGLSMQAAAPPERGTYLEIRRGQHEILGWVVWARNHRFGVRTQDELAIDNIIRMPDGPVAAPLAAEGLNLDRRLEGRCATERHEDSRILSRAMDFAMIGAFAAGAAILTFSSVAEALQQPLAKASAALTPR
jgi:hypothetical protein